MPLIPPNNPDEVPDNLNDLLKNPKVIEIAKEVKDLPWIFIDDLQKGDLLEIQSIELPSKTEINYLLQIVQPSTREILYCLQGKEFLQAKRGVVLGSIINSEKGKGYVLKIGAIGIGFPLALTLIEEERPWIFPATQEVKLNGTKILPDLSKIIPKEK